MFVNKYGVAILYLWILQIVKSHLDNGHCSITMRDKTFSSPRKIIPVLSNAMECSNFADDVSALKVSLCPNSRYIKFMVALNNTRDVTLSLCYNIQSVMDWRTLATYCYRIQLPSLDEAGQLDCWFPMEYIALRPAIIASLNISQEQTCHMAHGELSTGTLDIDASCTNTCDIPATRVRNIVSCDNIVTVSHDPNILILYATYTNNVNATCTDVEMETIKQDKSHTEFLIICENTGPGFILVWYVKNEVYCQRQHDVHSLCNTASITVDLPAVTGSRTETSKQQHGSTVYVILTVVSLIVIVVITTLVFVLVRRRQRLRNRQQYRRPVHYRAATRQTQPLIAL